MNQRDQELIDSIKSGAEGGMADLYKAYRIPFIQWVTKHYRLDLDSASDLFQDVVIAFYNNIKREKLVKLEYALKTYLFAIGKNLAHKRLEKNKYQSYIDISGFEIRFEDEHFEKQQEKEIIGQMIQKLGDNCKNIIKLFYFQRYSLESIAMELQYKDKNVVKVTKNRCIKELKKLFDKNLITKG